MVLGETRLWRVGDRSHKFWYQIASRVRLEEIPGVVSTTKNPAMRYFTICRTDYCSRLSTLRRNVNSDLWYQRAKVRNRSKRVKAYLRRRWSSEKPCGIPPAKVFQAFR